MVAPPPTGAAVVSAAQTEAPKEGEHRAFDLAICVPFSRQVWEIEPLMGWCRERPATLYHLVRRIGREEADRHPSTFPGARVVLHAASASECDGPIDDDVGTLR